eukprot:TRINITY_DN45638_c3_g1_i1.p1 TRINITY_DN45638_c3_g1~~TRINITY_DN45638_c3_g1_i1.p1  ORF type:complete len:101 (-),score=19.75 TRINITY_DN45638_c3_g1_i1:4-306(-)
MCACMCLCACVCVCVYAIHDFVHFRCGVGFYCAYFFYFVFKLPTLMPVFLIEANKKVFSLEKAKEQRTKTTKRHIKFRQRKINRQREREVGKRKRERERE